MSLFLVCRTVSLVTERQSCLVVTGVLSSVLSQPHRIHIYFFTCREYHITINESLFPMWLAPEGANPDRRNTTPG